MPIEFGIFDHLEMHGDQPVADLYDERIRFLKRAEEGGFYGFHLAEHHSHTLSTTPTAAVFLAALARETTKLKLIPTVVCLPLHNPVRLFEDLAMLDGLSHGRLEIGVGKGVTPYEHLQFGHSPDEATTRRDDILPMLLEAWETGIISSEQSKFYDFLELRLPFDRVQQPYPPLWTPGRVEAAGALGHHFISPVEFTPELRARYEELRAMSHGRPGAQSPLVAEPWLAQSQCVVIADTDEEAEAIGRRAWASYMKNLLPTAGLIPPHRQEEGVIPNRDNPLAKLVFFSDPVETNLVIAGTSERVRDYYLQQAQLGLANYFILNLPYGDMSSEEAAKTLDVFISEVIPAVRDLEAATPALGLST